METKQYKEFIHHFPDSAPVWENELNKCVSELFYAWHLKLAL